MGLLAWISDWSRTRSPWARSAQDTRRREAALDRISLRAADRALALLLGETPLVEIVGEVPDSYVEAFVRRYLGLCPTDLCVVDWTDPEGRRQVIAGDMYELYVLPGTHALVHADRSTRAANSIAHAILADALDADSLAALADDPVGWTPSPGAAAALRARPRYPAMPLTLALDERPRAWSLLGATVLVLVGLSLLAVVPLAIRAGSVVAALACWLPAALALFALGGRQLAAVLWLEPKARRLGIADDGFLDPTSGRRVRWAEVRSVSSTLGTVSWTLPDGRTFTAPRSVFVDSHRVELALRDRVGRGATAYRTRT